MQLSPTLTLPLLFLLALAVTSPANTQALPPHDHSVGIARRGAAPTNQTVILKPPRIQVRLKPVPSSPGRGRSAVSSPLRTPSRGPSRGSARSTASNRGGSSSAGSTRSTSRGSAGGGGRKVSSKSARAGPPKRAKRSAGGLRRVKGVKDLKGAAAGR